MLAVAGGKGGCGKTTTTLGLALAAGRRGRSVLAVDADRNVPDLHRVAGIDGPDERRPGSLDPTRSDERPRGEPRPVPGPADVSILPADPGSEPGTLRDRIRGTAEEYDLVLVDCPAGGGRDAAIPLRIVDWTVLVTTDAGPSLRDAAKTGAMARALGATVVGAVVTRTDRVPEGVDDLLGTSTVEAIPSAKSPLRNHAVIRRFLQFLRRLRTV